MTRSDAPICRAMDSARAGSSRWRSFVSFYLVIIIAWRASGLNYAGIRDETMCVGHGLEPGSEQRAEALGRGRARGRGGRLGSAAPSRKWLLCLLRRFERSGSESAKRT